MTRILLVLMLMAGAAGAEGEPAGAFDYYVLSLSWTPTWCACTWTVILSPRLEICSMVASMS